MIENYELIYPRYQTVNSLKKNNSKPYCLQITVGYQERERDTHNVSHSNLTILMFSTTIRNIILDYYTVALCSNFVKNMLFYFLFNIHMISLQSNSHPVPHEFYI